LMIRLSRMRLVSIFIDLFPLICAFMMISLFLFGLGSDISKTYYCFVRLYRRFIFGMKRLCTWSGTHHRVDVKVSSVSTELSEWRLMPCQICLVIQSEEGYGARFYYPNLRSVQHVITWSLILK
jgi:hypothetical protein